MKTLLSEIQHTGTFTNQASLEAMEILECSLKPQSALLRVMDMMGFLD